MRTFGLSDTAFGALAAGRPSLATLGELRRAQLSRHLLQLRAIGTVPSWYGGADTPARLADPMTALHTAATLAARRTGAPDPADQVFSGRRLTAEHDGLILRVRLEDTDPLRARLGVSPAGPLGPAAVAGWQRCLDATWRLLVDRHRPAAETLAAVLSVIIPVDPDPGTGGISATSTEAYGAVAISGTDDPVALAVGLLHEAQHNVLNAVLVLFDLIRPDPERGYSPWRDDPRPALGVLHGAYAYQAVTRFWRAEASRGRVEAKRRSSLAAFEFARWRATVVTAADTLLAGTALTPAGRRFTGALRDEVAGWLADPVDAEAARLAADANLEHRIRWRLRNLPVADETVTDLVEAWRAGAPPPPLRQPVLRDAERRELAHSERLAHVHRVLRERDQSPPAAGGVRPQADAQRGVRSGSGPDPYRRTAGDDAYLQGDREAAFAAFMKDLTDADPAVWSGLALVAPYSALRDRPEVVRALWLALGKSDLPSVADWLSRTGR